MHCICQDANAALCKAKSHIIAKTRLEQVCWCRCHWRKRPVDAEPEALAPKILAWLQALP